MSCVRAVERHLNASLHLIQNATDLWTIFRKQTRSKEEDLHIGHIYSRMLKVCHKLVVAILENKQIKEAF